MELAENILAIGLSIVLIIGFGGLVLVPIAAAIKDLIKDK